MQLYMKEIKYLNNETKIYIAAGFMRILLDIILAVLYLFSISLVGLVCFIIKVLSYIAIIKTRNKWIYRLSAFIYLLAEIYIIKELIILD